MMKRFLNVLSGIFFLCLAVSSCKETPVTPEEEPTPTKPVASIKVDDLQRTTVTFTITSDIVGDYAWAILPADQKVETAEGLFEKYTNGMFDSNKSVTVTYNELEGGKEYNIYYAVRQINPYVYSDLNKEPISTVFAYEDMITLEKVTPTAVSYHIEKPEGAKAYRHMIVDYNDFIYFKALVGVTHDSYLSAFGLGATESQTFEYEWVQMDGWDNYPTYFYSDTKYLIIAGESESTEIDSQVSPEDVKYIEFRTPKAEVCPHEVKVEISNITSLTADVTLTPEDGVDRYRVYPMSEADYQAFLFEGEEMVRRAVIGAWDDTSTEYTGPQSFTLNNLMPNTNYDICMVVFDEDMRELYIEKSFTTTEPVGPAPEIEIEALEVEEPWNTASINLKLKNTVSALAFIHTKYAVDEVLNAPGNEDVTMDEVISVNGESLSSAVLSKALTEEGATLVFSNLSPNTEYVYAIKATNSEYVATSTVFNFKTGSEPIIETTLFDKLKGEYTAQITDVDGIPYTFDVTITDGVNDATRESYKAQNVLVCLGFDPCGVEYQSPEDLLKKRWANNKEEANRNYGPKWFLEIDENDKITTYKHAIASSSFDEVNQATIIDYSAEGEDPMASFNGQTIWFKGTFERYYSSKDEWRMNSTTLIHNVDYNEETGVITVNPVTHFKSWSARGESITEYPGVSQSKNWYGGSDSKVIFCGGSALKLTPKEETKSQACIELCAPKELKAPAKSVVDIQKMKRTLRK